MTNQHSTTPLRRRMIEDMTLRKLSPKTQSGYIRAVRKLARFLGRSPDTATAEELRCFQLHLVELGVSSITLNATITGLRFFFEETLNRHDALTRMSRVYEPRKLPIILSMEEVTRLIEATGGLKYKAALSIAYGAGLRASEVVHLKVSDIDSGRMVIRVEQGKGKKDRYAMLSPALLELLRAWYRHACSQRMILPGGWLFPGQNPVNPLSTRQLNHALGITETRDYTPEIDVLTGGLCSELLAIFNTPSCLKTIDLPNVPPEFLIDLKNRVFQQNRPIAAIEKNVSGSFSLLNEAATRQDKSLIYS